MMLAGKWVWLWNWRRCAGGDSTRVFQRLRAAGCRGALVKAFDGPRWFDQGRPWRDIAAELKANGVPDAIGGWGYCYGNDPAGEAQRAIETAQYGQADLLVLDVEAEFKGRPQAAEELCRRIRDALGPDYPLYFSSFAIGLYQEGTVRYPAPEEVRDSVRLAGARGSRGVSFWSYEHMSEEMWQAVASAAIGEEEEEMSSQEFDQVSASVSQLSSRVDRLEAEVATIRAAPPVATAPRTYTVQPGDTLSGIAEKLGLGGWQRLYEVNAGVIGGDPDRIYPGQVLVVP